MDPIALRGAADDETSQSSGNDSDCTLKERGRKRVRHVEAWYKNKRRKRRAEGKSYTSTTGKRVPARKVGTPCNCRKKCFSRTTEEQREAILMQFNTLGNQEHQDSYLAGLMTVHDVKRRRQRKPDSTRLRK